MSQNSRVKQLGWGNQFRVLQYSNGAFASPEGVSAEAPFTSGEALSSAGDGLYRMAYIIDDQYGNPFSEADVSQSTLNASLDWITEVIASCPSEQDNVFGLSKEQNRQLRASAGVVLLSIAESQAERSSRRALHIVNQAMDLYFSMLGTEDNALLAERMVLNLDWVIPSLPEEEKARAQTVLNARIPWTPPYEAWFAGNSETLRVDWKCGSEFLEGWKRRLKDEGFELLVDGGRYGESSLCKRYNVKGHRTEVQMNLGPERANVFRRMDDPSFHICGYDGHSDWGRNIPRSLRNAPEQVGEKAIFYLLCCGKQILQKVRDVYPLAQLVTTFNSSKFTTDFRYSEDFTAFIHMMDGIARRESWEEIRARVNNDWYNNPEKNYIFPTETLAMARSLDQDHDGQADMFDKLLDFNTFDVQADTRREFTPLVPETPAYKIVGTRLHFAVQVFHTLAHFNQTLESFTHDLRVFADGWYDPTEAAVEGEVDRRVARLHEERREGKLQYFFKGNCHFAHASEEAWRALGTLLLCERVMSLEREYQRIAPEDRVLTGLLMAAHSLEVDDTSGRDLAIWREMLPALGLPSEISLSQVRDAKEADHHWYAGSRASVSQLRDTLGPEILERLIRWAKEV